MGKTRGLALLAATLPLIIASVTQSSPALAGPVGTWAVKAPLDTPRWIAGTAVLLDGRIVAVGGQPGYGCTSSNVVEAYDADANAWSYLPPMPTARYGPGVAVGSDGTLYAAGGGTACAVDYSIVEAFDPNTGLWSSRAPMSSTRTFQGGGVAQVDGMIYALGGNPRASCSDPETVEAYDPVTDSWTPRASIPLGSACSFAYLATAVLGGMLYVTGVDLAVAGTSIALKVYDPLTDTWSDRASVPTPFSGHLPYGGLALLGGLIYLLDSDQLWVYDPSTDTWTAGTPPTRTPWPSARSIVGAGGSLYAIGGLIGGPTRPVGDVDTFTPSLPTTADECKKGGWMTFGVFKNQGDCVSFVASKGRDGPAE